MLGNGEFRQYHRNRLKHQKIAIRPALPRNLFQILSIRGDGRTEIRPDHSPPARPHWAQNSVFNLPSDNGESKFAPPPRIDCRRTSDGSNECYHARTDPIGRAKIRSASRLPHVGCQTGQALGKSDQQQPGSNRENRYFEIHEGPVLNAIGCQRSG